MDGEPGKAAGTAVDSPGRAELQRSSVSSALPSQKKILLKLAFNSFVPKLELCAVTSQVEEEMSQPCPFPRGGNNSSAKIRAFWSKIFLKILADPGWISAGHPAGFFTWPEQGGISVSLK